MLNGLLHLSTDCKNEKPLGDVNTVGTFAVILASALNEIKQEKKVDFIISKNGKWEDDLFLIIKGKKVWVCKINGSTSVSKIYKAIEKKIKHPNL